MGTPQKFPLRELTQHEREELSQKAAGEEVSVGKRAKALLARLCTFLGKESGMKTF